MEGVLAAFAQFDNDVRSERTRAGMRMALEQGRWMFIPPVGYLNAPKWTGKSLMPDPERAALVTRAFEEFATGRFTKEEVLDAVTRNGFRTRSGSIMNPQSFGRMLTNRLYTAFIDMPHFGLSRRGDFDPLVSDDTFCRVQAILQGRIQVVGPHLRGRPDFPLKGLVRCADCGRSLTASWSKGRSGRYAYYHCWRQCRAVNVTKAKIEGLFTDELERLQPTPGYMRLVKDLVLRAWHEREAVVGRDAVDAERKAKAIQQKLDRLDEAFIYAKAMDLDTYERQRDRLRQELTLPQIDRQLRRTRWIRRRRHPRLRRAGFAESVGPVGAGLAESEAAATAAVLPGRDCIRRK